MLERKAGTLVEVSCAASFKGNRIGWVVKKCTKDGGTIVFIADEDLPYHEFCIKETDYIQTVSKHANI
jgi:hypothetical protein